MIHDAKVEVTCDTKGCWSHIEVEPPYVYATYGGSGGRYDTDDSTINRLAVKEGWRVLDGGTHVCDLCIAEETEDDE